MNGYSEEFNKSKYLTLVTINESKGKITKMKKYGVKSKI